jgi:uncharacterized protein (TIGR03067 family)
MKGQVLAAGVMAACVGVVCAQGDADNADKAKLQGTWLLVSGEAKGKAAPEELLKKQVALRFDGDKVLPLEGGKSKEKDEEARFTLDTSKTPREIDLIPLKGEDKEKRVVRGIYQIEGDTLKLLFGPGGARKGPDGKVTIIESKRPTAFDSQQGFLFIMKKQKS